jgi:hypothetical protein
VFAMKAYRKNGVAAPANFHLSSRFERSTLCPSGVTPTERIFSTHSLANWTGCRAGVNVLEKQKSVLIRTCIPDCPTHQLMAVFSLPFSLFFLSQCYHMSLMDFVVSPPGCGQSVTDFLGWDAHEAQLRCPDEVDGDI